jgi:UDP-N-acetylglucosamine--N-acetylmuramyl-(pentapeptide) pyrophosphoryl-undecaprenol N-acetylglucosamine transferase
MASLRSLLGWPAGKFGLRLNRSDVGKRVHLVASSGGHLELLTAITPAVHDRERIWVTPESNRADALRAQGDRVEHIPFYGRSPYKALSATVHALRLVLRERPDVIVTSGAGPVVPFCLASRLFGARLIFIETMARVQNASITGGLLSRFASDVMVQWPEMTSVYPNSKLCQPALLSRALSRDPADLGGTFAAVGTHVQPFDRLLEIVDDAVERHVLTEPVVVQTGVSGYQAKTFTGRPWMAPEEVEAAISRARYVVCHAGSGFISSALSAGRRPLVLPRLRSHGEHVDDHQLQIVRKLAEYGLVVPIGAQITEDDLRRADEPLGPAVRSLAETLPTIEDLLNEALAPVAA